MVLHVATIIWRPNNIILDSDDELTILVPNYPSEHAQHKDELFDLVSDKDCFITRAKSVARMSHPPLRHFNDIINQ